MTLVLVALIAIVGGGWWMLAAIEGEPVSRSRLELFARRHGLDVTVAGGNQVISYLAITRRWRVLGLTVGVLAEAGWTLVNSRLRVDSLALFAGWFAGALIAEFRLTQASFGPRRFALLATRRRREYLPLFAWALVPAAGILCGLVGIISVVAARQGHIGSAAWWWLLSGLGVALAVGAVQARVLRRPQPLADPDVLFADDAIRSRSLHVLAGAGTSLILYCVTGQLAALTPVLTASGQRVVVAANVMAFVAVPLLGWAVATARWPVRRPLASTSFL